ncbi:MAG: c-type cytochrome [Acidobacteria bacterium]|nr:c-type cytochrome [Acidobacteriota bacterium]
MSEDRKVDVPHDYDGIEELDNDLPRWWLGIFWVTTLFAVFYWPYYHWINPQKLPEAAWKAENAAREAERAAAPAETTESLDLDARYAAGGWEETGKTVFDTYCVPCHAADGGGGIGPNLTDDYYIHGGTLANIHQVISDGVVEKGMMSWKPVLKPDDLDAVAFFIRSLRGTTPASGIAPQGELVDESGQFVTQE